MAYFDALPVSGDAFLLMTRSARILVDGGRSPSRLAATLKGVKHLDAVICTHNDVDHAGGLVGLLSQPGAPSVGEFWLPGRWADQLEDLLLRPDAFVRELIDEIEQVYETFAGQISDWPHPSQNDEETSSREQADFDDLLLDRILPSTARKKAVVEQEDLGEDAQEWIARLQKNLAASLPDKRSSPPPLIRPRLDKNQASLRPAHEVRRLTAIVDAAIEAADRIRLVALAAICNNVRIRWFDFESFDHGAAPSGGWAWLVPVNACELRRLPKRPPTTHLAYLTLTKVNRECLVFQVLEDSSLPGVLFCGDSPLQGGKRGRWPPLQPTPTRRHIVTAPHHGRASNAAAYAVVDRWMGHSQSLWVKSGNAAPPCSELKSRLRFCNGCTARVSQNLQIAVQGNYWWALQWPPCNC